MIYLNPDQTGYLRGLEQELEEGTNSIRIELNRLEATGLIHSHSEGNKKANRDFPLF